MFYMELLIFVSIHFGETSGDRECGVTHSHSVCVYLSAYHSAIEEPMQTPLASTSAYKSQNGCYLQ